VLTLTTKHCFAENTTRLSLSHSWDTLDKLCYNPSTRYTLSIEWESDSPILPTLTIVPDLPFPNAILPPSVAVSERTFAGLFTGLFAGLFVGLFAGLFALTLACKTN